MKKVLLVVLTLFLAALILFAVFPEKIIDILPIDQSGWKLEENARYYLNPDGDPLTGWQELDGRRYYFDPATGAMHTGWLDEGGSRFYLDEEGLIVTGWIQKDGKRYYMDSDGAMVTGWLQQAEGRYYLGADGVPASGWVEADAKRYYLNEEGILQTGWLETQEGRFYLTDDGTPATGWLEMDETRYYLNEEGIIQTGWIQTEEGRFYLNEKGNPASGWTEIDGLRYLLSPEGTPLTGWQEVDGIAHYLNEDGTPATGWLEEGGRKYYLKEDGSRAVGKQVIDDQTWFFASTGEQIYMVNPWNYLPEDYSVELVELDSGHKISQDMQDALMQFMADCEAAGHKPYLYSSYRTQSHQQRLFNNMLQQEGSYAAAARIVAVPGTSEHQLGLAVDITDYSFRKLNKQQEKTATQQWLMEHCWDYGFILRYPSEKSTITGIMYEPWHYRYVGLELAREIKESGLCLEEYLDMLTNDGTTCGGGAA